MGMSRDDLRKLSDEGLAEYDMLCRRACSAGERVGELSKQMNSLTEATEALVQLVQIIGMNNIPDRFVAALKLRLSAAVDALRVAGVIVK